MTGLVKHATASVYVVNCLRGQWRIGLIDHPLHEFWMPPGGHVEAGESPPEAACRELAEETGLAGAYLLDAPVHPLLTGIPQPASGVAAPWWMSELLIPADNGLPGEHVHVDHQYVAVADDPVPARGHELPFVWVAAGELDGLKTFAGVRKRARALLACVGDLPDRRGRVSLVAAWQRTP